MSAAMDNVPETNFLMILELRRFVMVADTIFHSKSDLNLYDAMAYYRLSKEDGEGEVSDSISNQRKLIHAYVENHPNITLIEEAYDDGYTGTNFDRPGFQAVIEAVKSGRVNCVIVKDLSRLGREYIETGKYLEMIFPSFGVRFIAINDDIDSEKTTTGEDIIIPIKNIMNESYCRELSKKLRNQFRIQRSKGEYLGAFVCFGYHKSLKDKHKLVIDEYAAEIVRNIFSMKIKGYSQAQIANFLNKEQILPPAEYKKSIGLKYQSGFQGTSQTGWRAVTVSRILKNPIYIGTLVQGKRGTPNYKIKKMRVRDENEWVVVEHNHPPIIDSLIFSTVQKLMERDTRRSPYRNTVLPLAGTLFCPDCQRAMQLRNVKRGNRKYYYYVCATYKNGKGCSSHSIEQNKLENIVLRTVINQIQMIVEMDQLIQKMDSQITVNFRVKGLDIKIAKKNEDLDSLKEYRAKLYEALTEDLIDRDEYNKMRQKYTIQIQETEESIRKLNSQRESILLKPDMDRNWVLQFAKYQNIQELSREAVVTMIDRIYVYGNSRIKIDFNYRDEIARYQNLVKQEVM